MALKKKAPTPPRYPLTPEEEARRAALARIQRPSRSSLVLKGLTERDDPRAFYRGSWSRTEGALYSLSSYGWAEVSFGVWRVPDAGLDAYVYFDLWAVRVAAKHIGYALKGDMGNARKGRT